MGKNGPGMATARNSDRQQRGFFGKTPNRTNGCNFKCHRTNPWHLTMRNLHRSTNRLTAAMPAKPAVSLRAHPLPTNWSWRRDLNPRPSDYKSDALPAELRQQSTPTFRKRPNSLHSLRPATDTYPSVGTKQINYHTKINLVNNNFLFALTRAKGSGFSQLSQPSPLPHHFVHDDARRD